MPGVNQFLCSGGYMSVMFTASELPRLLHWAHHLGESEVVARLLERRMVSRLQGRKFEALPNSRADVPGHFRRPLSCLAIADNRLISAFWDIITES